MTRVAKGECSRPALVCSRAKSRGGCVYKAVPCEGVEETLRTRAAELVRDAPVAGEELRVEIEVVSTALDNIGEELEHLVAAVAAGGQAETLVAEIREWERQKGELEERLESLRQKQADTSNRLVERRLAELKEALEGGPLDIAAANRAMKLVADHVVVNWPETLLEIHWRFGGSKDLPGHCKDVSGMWPE